jgi:hypothetical protein
VITSAAAHSERGDGITYETGAAVPATAASDTATRRRRTKGGLLDTGSSAVNELPPTSWPSNSPKGNADVRKFRTKGGTCQSDYRPRGGVCTTAQDAKIWAYTRDMRVTQPGHAREAPPAGTTAILPVRKTETPRTTRRVVAAFQWIKSVCLDPTDSPSSGHT